MEGSGGAIRVMLSKHPSESVQIRKHFLFPQVICLRIRRIAKPVEEHDSSPRLFRSVDTSSNLAILDV